tara:strand:+ start:164 stop:937 length:774 start_codon:yes stop_codon:yes gene_type:complete
MEYLNKEYFVREYLVNKRSFASIAEEFSTYPNKIRRAAISVGIVPRGKSEAQSQALKSGRHGHPTKGKKHSAKTREKISNSVYEKWQTMGQEERDRRSEISKKQWEGMTEEQKRELHKLSAQAIRKASKEGSKLEKYILEQLIEEGYRVDFHKRHMLLNERLEIDMFVPELSVAIEIDGPSHFLPVWGQEALEKTQKSDRQKSGLVLSSGMILIRIKHTKGLSEKYKRETLISLKSELDKLKKKFPSKDERLILIGE